MAEHIRWDNKKISFEDSPADASLPSLDAGILKDVRKLGRRPRELRNKHRELTDEEKFERLLAEQIRRNRDKLLPTTQVSLEEMQSDYKWISVVKRMRDELGEVDVESSEERFQW